MKLIPRGKVATYGQLARKIGSPQAARAVGAIVKTNPHAPRVPCHRVVSATGHLTGYSAAGGLAKKAALLKSEGVSVVSDRVNLLKYGWKK